jgi:hypothetical protein
MGQFGWSASRAGRFVLGKRVTMAKNMSWTEADVTTEGQTRDYQEREIELNGWPVRLTTYRLGSRYVAQADNVSPGAVLARFAAESLEEAEANAISKARHLLGKTRRHDVSEL